VSTIEEEIRQQARV